ncbi:MAG TPA: DUF5616 domain-containing protein [Blastocatellia bacterium]|nr:DUF5616 domain-containing protein [Blastocatellia bacterium]
MSPDSRQHRGAHPEDRELFAADQVVKLRTATSDLCWLRERINRLAADRGRNWTVELANNPDKVIGVSGCVAVTSDSAILDQTVKWIALANYLVARNIPGAWLVDLRTGNVEIPQPKPY